MDIEKAHCLVIRRLGALLSLLSALHPCIRQMAVKVKTAALRAAFIFVADAGIPLVPLTLTRPVAPVSVSVAAAGCGC